jgi:hypothetical protein
MESLFHNTPCGSFVFWKPSDPAEHGVPLDELVADRPGEPPEYFVVDGQQRIRSIRMVFFDTHLETEDEHEEGEDSDKKGPRVWCINLTKAPSFRSVLEETKRDYPLFVNALDPIEASEHSPLRYNLLPLRLIRNDWPTWSDVPERYRSRVKLQSTDGEAAVACAYASLRQGVLDMARREFFVVTRLNENLAEMVDLYNRINAGGKRVEIEERAFAKLVSFYPDSWKQVADLFEKVHGSSKTGASDGSREAMARDRALERIRERQFGFKLFIRVFMQVCHYHFGYRLGTKGFSFDIVRKPGLLKQLSEVTPDKFRELWAKTRDVIEYVIGVLREPLMCDDLRFLPEVHSLAPIFQLLIQFPGLQAPRYKSLVAALCLRLLLAELEGRSLVHMLAQIRGHGLVAFDVIPKILEQTTSAVTATLSKRLAEADSIQDRFVLLLYWLERSRGAKDFYYGNVPKSELAARAGQELIVGRNRGGDEASEKQHMVPFSKLVDILGDDDARRSGSHPFNNIGNLTYISGKLNHFDTGYGSEMANLEDEDSNLPAHFLVDPDTGADTAWQSYHAIFKRFESQRPEKKFLKRQFRKMCDARRDSIRCGFLQWIEELDRAARLELGVSSLDKLGALAKGDDRIEPDRQICVREQGVSRQRGGSFESAWRERYGGDTGEQLAEFYRRVAGARIGGLTTRKNKAGRVDLRVKSPQGRGHVVALKPIANGPVLEDRLSKCGAAPGSRFAQAVARFRARLVDLPDASMSDPAGHLVIPVATAVANIDVVVEALRELSSAAKAVARRKPGKRE